MELSVPTVKRKWNYLFRFFSSGSAVGRELHGLALDSRPADVVEVQGVSQPFGKAFTVHAISMALRRGTISDEVSLTFGTIGSMIRCIMNTNPIHDAIRAAGSGPKLAQQLGISARAIYKWAARWDDGILAAVPAHRAIEIEAATGISRSQLRPDLWGEESSSSRVARHGA